jgi:CheY-like chemotaxis protein
MLQPLHHHSDFLNAQELIGCPTNNQLYDLIILDLNVPSGMGGQATFAELRKVDPDVTALDCSCNSDDATGAHRQAFGFVGMLAKPDLAHELFSTAGAAISQC